MIDRNAGMVSISSMHNVWLLIWELLKKHDDRFCYLKHDDRFCSLALYLEVQLI